MCWKAEIFFCQKKVCIFKPMVFKMVTCGCESWTKKKADCQRIDAFKLWHWRGLWESLRQQGDQTSQCKGKSTLNIHWKDLMLKLKLHYFGHLMRTADSLEKSLKLGNIEGKRRGHQRMRRMGITDEMDMNFRKLREIMRHREAWHAAVHGVTKSWTWLDNWTTTTSALFNLCSFYHLNQS